MFRPCRLVLIACCVTASLGIMQPIRLAHAQEPPPQWQFYFTPYLWMSGMSGTASTSIPRLPSRSVNADFNQSFVNILSHLEGVPFMGAAEVRYGRFGLMSDLMYLSVSSNFSTRDVLFNGGNTKMSTLTGTILGTYRLVQTENQAFDLGAGLRPWSVTSKLTFNGGLLPGFSKSPSVSWVDPILAARYHVDLPNRFGLTVYGDIGGFGAGSQFTWQVLGTVDYSATYWLVLHLGYRHLHVDYNAKRDLNVNFALSGPILAGTIRF